jgi:hypothetical protein
MKRILLSATIAVMPLAMARADVAITDFTGGTAKQYVNAPGNTVGFKFTPTVDVLVSALGLYDPTSYGDPLTVGHDVGLWNSSGTLLASTVVSPGGPTVGGYYYSSIGSVELLAGQSYDIGAYFNGSTDWYVYDTATVTTDSNISFGGGTYNQGASLADPTSTTSTFNGRFGPNFQFSAAVPEPGSLAIFAAGLAGLCVVGLQAARRRLQ